MTSSTEPEPGAEALAPGLRELDPALAYDSADSALAEFYVPCLGRAVRYDRSVGFFRASALSVAARGMSRFIAGGGKARFLVGAEVGEDDQDALTGVLAIPEEFAARLAASLVAEDEVAERRLEVLAWLVREERLEIRVAVAVDPSTGVPLPPGLAVPYFHEKVGVLWDAGGDGVAFQGSVNESYTAWATNFESFSVYRSWDGTSRHFDLWAAKFEQRWAGDIDRFRVFPLPEAVRQELVRLAPAEPPSSRDPEEAPARAEPRILARFLLAAPRLAGGEALAEATSGVSLFPHQRKVVARLAGQYPRSWLVADEVGLGKTISAGLALRRLVLSGDVERALVLAPANVCRQWQDELFEKFGLWVPRLESGKFLGAHPDDIEVVPPGANPYDQRSVMLVSSHLARREQHRRWILEARPWDLVVVDEAHHARRRAADLDEYRPSRLLELLDSITATDHARAVWLMTATPMQMHQVELHDLLRHVGLDGALAAYGTFARYYAELAKTEATTVDWGMVARLMAQSPALGEDAADWALLDRLGAGDPVRRERLLRFGKPGEDGAALAVSLDGAGREGLRQWARQRGPVGRLVTRHSRQTLKRYRAAGLLDQPIADRDVRSVPIAFSPEEQKLYEELDDLIGALMEAHGTKRGVGFVLTVYRRRLTSSWEAIRRTLARRLARQSQPIELDQLDEADEAEMDTGEGATVADADVLPLSPAETAVIEKYLHAIDHLGIDSKFDQLRSDIDEARRQGRAMIVFSQFTDTLDSLRDRLVPAYRSHLATYSGGGGRQFREGDGWVDVSKQELVEALRSGRVSVVLATDAASEGLNLQAASVLISYDLPWNPMRIEQRIGRIDRIGQPEPIIRVRNYTVPGTVEQDVYDALAERIDLFAGLVGALQPILGATEEAFRRIFRAPRSERALIEREEIERLLRRVDELDRSGLDLSDEDPMPEPVAAVPAVTLEALHRCLVEDLDVSLDTPGRPATARPERVSRDADEWTALATFGHPALIPALERIAGEGATEGTLVVKELGRRAAVYRADRIPPQRVQTLADLVDLGPSVAAGEAENLAELAAAHADAERRACAEAVTRSQRGRWDRSVRERFRRLVAQAIRAEALLRLRQDGEEPDPALLWMELTGDQTTQWVSGDPFRQHLGMELAELLPRGGAGADNRPVRELSLVRRETAEQLVALIMEWQEGSDTE